jgi:glutathione reductase (NADPH)
MEAEKLPERIIFIGGGHISLEFAHIARRAGSDVTILHRSERLLRSFDSDVANLLIKASEAVGIKILTNQHVISIEKKADSFLVSTEFKSKTRSETQSSKTDMVVHGASRVPDIEDLFLEKAEVKIEKGAIIVDKHMRTSSTCIYTGGDCALEGRQLTPVAKLQGEIAAVNILDENSVRG